MCTSATRICADCRTRSFGRCLLTLPLPDAAYSLGESSECCERQCCKNQRSFEMLMTSAMGGGQVRLRCFDTLRGRSSVLTLRHLSCNTAGSKRVGIGLIAVARCTHRFPAAGPRKLRTAAEVHSTDTLHPPGDDNRHRPARIGASMLRRHGTKSCLTPHAKLAE